MCMQLFSKLDSSPETYVGALASHIMGWCPLLFDPQGAFLHLWNVSLAPRMGNIWCPDPLLKQGFSSVQSLSCVQLFVTPWISARQASLLLLWLLRWHRRQSLAMYSVCDVTSISEGKWEPIYPVSGNANWRLNLSVQPEAHLFFIPRNVNRRPVVT